MRNRLLITAIMLLSSLGITGFAQSYYDRQAQNRAYDRLHEATTRAFSVPTSSSSSSSYKSPSFGSGSSSSSSSSSTNTNTGGGILPASQSSWANTSYYDWQVRQGEKLERENAARLSNFNKAKADFQKIIATKGHAKTEEDHWDLFLTGMRAGIPANAIQAVIGYDIQAYTKTYGTSGTPFQKTDRELEYVNLLIAGAYTQKDLYQRAGIYERIVQKVPSAEMYRALGDTWREYGGYAQAIKAYKTSDSLQPNSFATLFGWATCLGLQGKGADGEKMYLRVLQIAPDAPVDMNLAWMRVQQRRSNEAQDAASGAAKKAPNDPGPLLVQAALTAAPDLRTSFINSVVSRNPALTKGSLAEKLFAHAKYLQADGSYELSLMFLDLAVAADPKNIDFLELRYGTNKLLKREVQAAIDETLMEKL